MPTHDRAVCIHASNAAVMAALLPSNCAVQVDPAKLAASSMVITIAVSAGRIDRKVGDSLNFMVVVLGVAVWFRTNVDEARARVLSCI